MLNVNDRIFVSLKIDGQELPYANLLHVTLTEGNGALVPAFQIDLADPTSLLSNSDVLTEGNTVDILISRSHTDTQAVHRKYRVFSPKRENNALNPTLSVVGILNTPLYITASKIEAFKGNSDVALRELAQKCGLRYSGPADFNGKTLADQQTWLNVCKNRASFAQDVARHGWADDHSGMGLTLTSLGELRYRNLTDVINTPASKIKFVFYHSAMPSSDDVERKGYVVRQVHDRSVAGVMSNWVNYGNTRVQNSLTGESVVMDKLAVKLPGPYLPINADVSGTVGRARVDYAPIDCGNVHAKYQTAFYQNMRIRALFSERLSLLVNDVTEVELYEPVIYRQADADISAPIKNSDIYMVVGKTVAMRGGIHYAERIELARMSLTMKGNADLQKPGSFGSERSLIPDVRINQTAIGTLARDGAASAKSVASAINDLSSVADTLTNLPSLVTGALDQGLACASKVLTDLTAGLFDTETLENLALVTQTVLDAVVQVGDMVHLAKGVADSALTATQNLPYAIRSSVITRTGSVADNLATQIGVSVPVLRTVQFVAAVIDRLPPEIQSSAPVGKARAATSSSTTELLDRILPSIAHQWNKSAGSLRNSVAPRNLSDTRTVDRLLSALQNFVTPDGFRSIVQTEISREVARAGNWINPSAFASHTLSVSDLGQVARSLNTGLKQWGVA